jgi:hypothetical protein
MQVLFLTNFVHSLQMCRIVSLCNVLAWCPVFHVLPHSLLQPDLWHNSKFILVYFCHLRLMFVIFIRHFMSFSCLVTSSCRPLMLTDYLTFFISLYVTFLCELYSISHRFFIDSFLVHHDVTLLPHRKDTSLSKEQRLECMKMHCCTLLSY